ncbi:MAG: hypothetical protein FD124_298 [Alphaproteobacteria bacterium]|nr:MAG: hypothetical protein FD124_298 [Alphaproteobacteria bacterium]
MLFRSAASAAALVLVCGLSACSGEPPKTHGEAQENRAVVVTAIATPPTKKEIASLFDDWNDVLRTGGPHDMALLYAEDGVLLPTVSNAVRSNRVEIADYFEHFLALHPRGVINEQHIDVLDANTAVNSGVYTFDVIKEGQPTFVVARYSFLYEKVGGKWLIKSHHSSAMPEAITARPSALVAAAEEPSMVADLRPSTGHDAPAAPAPPHGGGHGEGHGAGGGH